MMKQYTSKKHDICWKDLLWKRSKLKIPWSSRAATFKNWKLKYNACHIYLVSSKVFPAKQFSKSLHSRVQDAKKVPVFSSLWGHKRQIAQITEPSAFLVYSQGIVGSFWSLSPWSTVTRTTRNASWESIICNTNHSHVTSSENEPTHSSQLDVGK